MPKKSQNNAKNRNFWIQVIDLCLSKKLFNSHDFFIFSFFVWFRLENRRFKLKKNGKKHTLSPDIRCKTWFSVFRKMDLCLLILTWTFKNPFFYNFSSKVAKKLNYFRFTGKKWILKNEKPWFFRIFQDFRDPNDR